MGTDKKIDRMIAFASLVLGELIVKQSLSEDGAVERARSLLDRAYAVYNHNASVLSAEEFSRVCLSLSTVARHQENSADAKRYLELARDKTTDKRMLLSFYIENAKQLVCEELFH